MTTYALGHAPSELERLQAQAGYLRRITEAIWRAAGIGAGMRVLDAGCGAGDTTFLAADLVGSGGRVVGMDRSADAIATARQRAAAEGRFNVQFVEGDFGAPHPQLEQFDAVVGRFVLVHQPSIVTTLRNLGALVRPGGLLAFHEPELEFHGVSDPSSDLVDSVAVWIREACRLAGMQLNAVSQMPRYFHEAGLGWPGTVLHLLASSGPESFGPSYAVRTLRPLAPLLERAGIVTAEQIGIDTLETRLRESCANGTVSLQYVNGGAWARLPPAAASDAR